MFRTAPRKGVRSARGETLGERLDEEKLETLRAWGAGLSSDARDEIRAAGRAIQLLIEEIDLLNVDLWNLRAAGTLRDAFEAPVDAAVSDDAGSSRERDQTFERSLRWRLAGFRQPRSPAE